MEKETGLLNRFVAAKQEKKHLEEQLKEINAECAFLEEQILDRFASEGITQQKTVGGQTVYVRNAVYASLRDDPDGTKTRAHQALRAHGLGYLIRDTVNGQSLSAWAKETINEFEEIPNALKEYVKVTEKPQLNVKGLTTRRQIKS